MTVLERLDRLRAATEGCSLAAFGDLRTRLVLRVSSENPWPQERLDDLCKTAARCFGQADSAAIRDGLLGGVSAPVNEAMVLGAREIRMFVRSDEDPSDMICCVCQSAEDVAVLSNGARAAIRDF